MSKNILMAWLLAGSLIAVAGEPLTGSVFTEIIQESNVLTETRKTGKSAKTSQLSRVPDLIRTGQGSRVELAAKDGTITRIGSCTKLTFAKGRRDVILQKGGVLFHSPAGAGGGAIRYRGTSAAVLGTTEIAQVLKDGRFKVLDLEGTVKVSLANGEFVILKAGQGVIVSSDGTAFEDIMNFNIGDVVSHLLLVVGFYNPVASNSLIAAAIALQNQAIANGTLTGLVSWMTATEGMDIALYPMNDSNYYFSGQAEWNPLDFPGGPEMVFIPVKWPMINSPVIEPPFVTQVNPPAP